MGRRCRHLNRHLAAEHAAARSYSRPRLRAAYPSERVRRTVQPCGSSRGAQRRTSDMARDHRRWPRALRRSDGSLPRSSHGPLPILSACGGRIQPEQRIAGLARISPVRDPRHVYCSFVLIVGWLGSLPPKPLECRGHSSRGGVPPSAPQVRFVRFVRLRMPRGLEATQEGGA